MVAVYHLLQPVANFKSHLPDHTVRPFIHKPGPRCYNRLLRQLDVIECYYCCKASEEVCCFGHVYSNLQTIYSAHRSSYMQRFVMSPISLDRI